ncbi:MAG: ATP-binding protein [Rhodothermales bacterium]|nr:ATP-binding protein [Rhodothermales bacterium]
MQTPPTLRRLARRTLARDLTVGLSVVILLVILGIGALSYVMAVGRAEQALAAKAAFTADRLADILAQPLWNLEDEETTRIARVYTEQEGIVRLRLYDEDGARLFAYAGAADAAPAALVEQRAVRYRGRPVGTLEVAFSRDDVRTLQTDIALFILLLLGGVTISVVVVIQVLLQRYLARPLDRLKAGLGMISGGAYGHRLPDEPQADLRAISSAVNAMAEAIEWRTRELERGKEDLEARVAARTAELTRANMQLRVEVAERRRAEEALRDGEARYRVLVEHAPDAVVVLDMETGCFVDCNGMAERLYGLPRAALLQTSPVAMRRERQPHGRPPPEAADAMTPDAAAGGTPAFEWMHRNADGETIPCEVRLVRLPWAGRDLLRASITDITERKRAEDALRASEARLKESQRLAHLGTWEWCLETGTQYWSDALWQLLGLEPGAASPDLATFFRYVHPDDRAALRAALARVQAGHDEAIPEFRILQDGGEERTLASVMQPFYGAGGQPSRLLGTLQDVTERKRAEETLRAAKEAAEAGTRARSQFLANMSHEIRTPMNGVVGVTELLAETPLSEQQREYLGVIRTSGEALLTIINDILDFSKIEAGQMQVAPGPCAVQDCVAEAIDVLAGEAVSKDLRITRTIDPSVPARVVTDATRLRQILVNLLANAVKFTQRGGVEVGVRAVPPAQGGGPYTLHFSVQDTGIGIDPARLGALFTPFVQGDASTTRRYGGTGLGLSISKRLCHLLGGDIWAQSTPGEGTTFHFSIQAAAAEAPAVLPPAGGDGAVPAVSAPPALRLLLAEDNPVNRMVAVQMLKRLGYEADVVVNGREVLAALHHQSYAVVLMDMQMPEMSGLEAARRIRAELPPDRQPHLIAFTAHAMQGDRERYLAAGLDDYVSKPVQLAALRDALARAAV